ncbi:Uncharacterised protein [Mycobacteroides abscessus subsp. abscessus]|nr:Uncharacterised protein [Mycobacteroides abscessus subsp. abscessus]
MAAEQQCHGLGGDFVVGYPVYRAQAGDDVVTRLLTLAPDQLHSVDEELPHAPLRPTSVTRIGGRHPASVRICLGVK